MCGIAGFVARQGNLLQNSTITGMTGIINHRGPDDEGFLFFTEEKELITAGGESTPDEVWKTKTDFCPVIDVNNYLNRKSLMALGHKRLSILDLSPAGHQPMSYDNGRFWIVFNGEIYNYQDIKSELEKRGHVFKTKSDTETVLAAYSEWGESCLDKLVGMWAFAIFDRGNSELFIARDRYGIKPLYYYFSAAGDFYFASEIKQFTVLDGWQSRMNPQRVYDQLVYSFTDHTDETMFSRVYQLPGGTYFKSSIHKIIPSNDGRIQFIKWYFIRSEPFKGSFSDAATIFRSLFEKAVNEHLHADVPVGTALSGGLDSSSIVCEVNRILLSEGAESLQKTFSSCSIDERYSEKKWMDVIINHTNIDAYFIFPSLNEALGMTKDILWHHDEPYQSQSAFLAYNVFKLASSNKVKVLLNGQGADEYLGGYGQFTYARYASMLKHLKISSVIADIKKSNKINKISNSALMIGIFSYFLPSVLRKSLKGLRNSTDNIKELVDHDRLNITPEHPFKSTSNNYRRVPEISEHFTFTSTLPKYLHWEDRNSMAHSVEARVPFLDHRLVEFCYNLPDDFLEKDGITKRVMREAMTGLLPELIRNRKDKMGFTTPEELWVKKENPGLFRDKIAEAVVVSDGIIKPASLKYFDDIVDGKLPFNYTYWRFILFSEWIQKFQVTK
jgi:asparagine synthase (glutamine-hydrolysing)